MAEDAGPDSLEKRLKLRSQVIAWMAIALSPLLILAGIQVLGERERANRQQFQELVEISRDSVMNLHIDLESVRVALRLVAADVRTPSCSEVGAQLATLGLQFRNVLRFDTAGEVTCHLRGEDLIGQPMPDLQWNERLRKGMVLIESTRFEGLALGDPVIWMVHSVPALDGTFAGSVAITVSLSDLAAALPQISAAPGFKQALVSEAGVVYGSDIVGKVPVEWLTSEAMLKRSVRSLVLPMGGRVDVVLMPLEGGGLWVMTPSSVPQNQVRDAIIALIIPLMAYLAALFAATWIMDALVLRWLERLRLRISDLKREEEYSPLLAQLAGAPSELQQLAKAFDELTDRVSVHESDLRQALSQMTGAFRETHHRVKNNLQVMLSMLKLQGRSEFGLETQHALRIAAHRVSMMAAVHHELLNESHMDAVATGDLFDAICSQIHDLQGWGEEARYIAQDVQPGQVPSDIAVPLAMFVQEAFDILCPPSREGVSMRDLHLHFKQEDDEGCVRVSCGREASEDFDARTEREASIFLAAFARQLGGNVEHITSDLKNAIIELKFPLPSSGRTASPPSQA